MQSKDSLILGDSFVGKFAQKLSLPVLSEFLILSSVLLFWYEGFFAATGLGFLGGAVVPTLLLVLALVFADKSKIKITRSHIYLILFYVWALFSGLLAVGRGISPILILSGWALFVQFLVAILAARGVAKPIRLIRNIIYISIPMIAVGAYQFFTNQSTSRLWVSPAEASISTRAFAFFGSPNVLGAVLAMLALVSLGLYLSEKTRVMAVISDAAAVVTVFTFSRSAWMGLVAGLILVTLIRNGKLIFWAPLAALGLVVPQVWQRVSVIFTSLYWFDSSLDGRLWALNNGLHVWVKYPIFGSGPGTYGGKLALNYASPVYLQGIQEGYVALYFTDNQWLQLLVQTGLIGVILFALFAAHILLELVTKYNKGKAWLPLSVGGAFVAFIVAGFFGNVLEFGAIAVPMGIMLGVALSESRCHPESERRIQGLILDSSQGSE